MLESYLDQQQRDLEELGQGYQEQQQLLRQQNLRLERLQALHHELAAPECGTALDFTNRQGLRGQVAELLKMQQQETDLASLSCERSRQDVQLQLRKVKHLELVLQRRRDTQRRKQTRREQTVLDDWINSKKSSV